MASRGEMLEVGITACYFMIRLRPVVSIVGTANMLQVLHMKPSLAS
ncbi:hypothetical protein KCP73_15360 [Salmonella enterica subsp. enterica]|nr:hypothetical protein KCP73_15360 [Salmonella enterica subsp. enterica]